MPKSIRGTQLLGSKGRTSHGSVWKWGFTGFFMVNHHYSWLIIISYSHSNGAMKNAYCLRPDAMWWWMMVVGTSDIIGCWSQILMMGPRSTVPHDILLLSIDFPIQIVIFEYNTLYIYTPFSHTLIKISAIYCKHLGDVIEESDDPTARLGQIPESLQLVHGWFPLVQFFGSLVLMTLKQMFGIGLTKKAMQMSNVRKRWLMITGDYIIIYIYIIYTHNHYPTIISY